MLAIGHHYVFVETIGMEDEDKLINLSCANFWHRIGPQLAHGWLNLLIAHTTICCNLFTNRYDTENISFSSFHLLLFALSLSFDFPLTLFRLSRKLRALTKLFFLAVVSRSCYRSVQFSLNPQTVRSRKRKVENFRANSFVFTIRVGIIFSPCKQQKVGEKLGFKFVEKKFILQMNEKKNV